MTRRCLRIYPLSLFVVSLVYLSHIPAAHINNWSTTGANHASAGLVPSLLLVQNFFQVDQLLEPLWSLPYEIQMYCLFPWIFLALRRFKSAKVVVFAWASLAATQFVLGPHLAKHQNLGHTFAVPEMMFYFLWFVAGIHAYKEMQRADRVLPFWTLPAQILFSSLLCCLSYDNNKFIFLGLCFGLALPYIRNCHNTSLNHVCGWVARYSYGIYLLHDPAIWLGFVHFVRLPLAARVSIFCLTTFGGSVALYHALEHPMILLGNRLSTAIAKKRPAVILRAAAATGGSL